MLLTIELFGCLKDTGLGEVVELELAEGSTVRQAIEALGEALGTSVQSTVLATEERLLAPGEQIPEGVRLAALPPVCGG